MNINLKHKYLTFLFLTFYVIIKAQCPQFYDGNGNLSSNPYWISCGGGSYNLNLQGGSNFGAYSIDWGDGTAITTGSSYTSPTIISHPYSTAIDTFIVLITTGTCTVQGVVVMEKPVNAGIQIPPTGGVASCAPKVLQFINASTNVSETTHFIWNFGDGTGPQNFDYTNAGLTLNHLYNSGTINCQTAVTLSAYNYCTFGSLTTVNYSPVRVYDKDSAVITCSVIKRCWPDNIFTYSNTTKRNCLTFGNITQRYEKWNFGNYWGYGHDSIVDWRAWPPTAPISIAYPAIGTYTAMLLDSSLCGIVTKTISVSIINKPTSLISVTSNSVCQGIPITFTNSSTPGHSYNWNFDKGAGVQTLPYGNQTQTYFTPGSYTVSLVTYIAGSNAYCSDTSKVNLSVKPKPVSNFSFSPVHGCDNSSVTFTDLSTGTINGWDWNFGNGQTSVLSAPPAQSYTAIGHYTVSLITLTTNGCKDTLDKVFDVYPSPNANFTVNTTCTGYSTLFVNTSTFTVSDPITSYNWDFGDGTPIVHTTNPSHIYSTAGTYTVSLQAITLHCSSTKTLVLTVNQKPTANFIASNYTVCPSTLITFTNTSIGASSYNWTLGTGSTSTSTNTSETYSNTTLSIKNYSVWLVALSSAGCKDSIRKIIVVNPKPQALYSSTYTPSCAPVKIQFNNATLGGTSYAWNFGDAGTSTITNPNHTYTNTTLVPVNFSVTLVANNTYGCKDSIVSTFLVYPQAIYNFTPTAIIGCSPKSATLATGLGGVNYLWDFDDGSLFSGSNIQTHTFINTTAVNDTFNVKLITTNAYGCKDTAMGQVIVKPSPKSLFAPSVTSGCANLFVNFSNTSTGALTYNWYFGDGTTSTALIPSHTYTNNSLLAINESVALVTTASNGCTDSAVANITVYPIANYTFALAQDTGCSIFNVPFNTTPGAVSYFWAFGDGTTQTAFNPVHGYSTTFPTGQSFTATMTATSPYGCQNTQSVTVFVYPKPTASFTVTNPIGCAPLITSFNNLSVGATSYNWYFGDGGTSSAISTSHTYSNPGSIPQNFYASLVAIDLNGCKDSVTSIINAYPEANYSFATLPDSGCSALHVNFPTSLGATTYAWDYGDGIIGLGANPSHTFINGTTSTVIYTVTLIATNAYGCKDTMYSTVKVFSVPNANFSAGPIIQRFPAATVTYSNTSSTGYPTYNWSLGDGTSLSTYSIAPHTYTTWGVYNVQLLVDNGHCRDSITQTVTILPPFPIAAFDGGKVGCQPLSVTFTNNSIYSNTYIWDFGDGNTLSAPNPTHIYNTPGTYTVTLKAFGPGGSDTLIKQDIVIVYEKPFAYFIATPLLVYVPNDPVYFTNQSVNAVSYQWDFGDGGTSTNTNPIYKYLLSGEYPVTLIATSEHGCVDTFKLESTIKAQAVTGIEIPNAFTPNPNGAPAGDGKFDPTALNNDIFHPNLKGIVDYDLTIYNKWGELLFHTTDQNYGWNGYYKGKLCPEDVYIYKITALTEDAKVLQKAGDVTLIR